MDESNSFLDLPEFLVVKKTFMLLPRNCPKPLRLPVNKDIPQEPGEYYWSEYKSFVSVVERRGKLYVTPPLRGSVEIQVTPRIAGRFTAVRQGSP